MNKWSLSVSFTTWKCYFSKWVQQAGIAGVLFKPQEPQGLSNQADNIHCAKGSMQGGTILHTHLIQRLGQTVNNQE